MKYCSHFQSPIIHINIDKVSLYLDLQYTLLLYKYTEYTQYLGESLERINYGQAAAGEALWIHSRDGHG